MPWFSTTWLGITPPVKMKNFKDPAPALANGQIGGTQLERLPHVWDTLAESYYSTNAPGGG